MHNSFRTDRLFFLLASTFGAAVFSACARDSVAPTIDSPPVLSAATFVPPIECPDGQVLGYDIRQPPGQEWSCHEPIALDPVEGTTNRWEWWDPTTDGWRPDTEFDNFDDDGGGGNPSPDPIMLKIAIICPNRIPFASTASCNVTHNTASKPALSWSFDPVANTPNTAYSGAGPWGGIWVTSGTMTVVATLNGQTSTSVVNVVVEPRTTELTWKPSVVANDYPDSCMGSYNAAALLSGKVGQTDDCSSTPILPREYTGVTLAEGSGPNAGAFYVTDHQYHIEYHWALTTWIRGGLPLFTDPADPTCGTTTTLVAYNVCKGNGSNMSTYQSLVTAHEIGHINRAIAASAKGYTGYDSQTGQPHSYNLPGHIASLVGTPIGIQANVMSKVSEADELIKAAAKVSDALSLSAPTIPVYIFKNDGFVLYSLTRWVP